MIYFTLTTSKLLSFSVGSATCKSPFCPMLWITFPPFQPCCCCHISLHTSLKWFYFLLLLHFLLYVGHCWGGCPFPQYLHLPTLLCILGVVWSCSCLFCLTVSKSFASFMPLRANFCALCTSNLCTYSNTHSLVASLVSSYMATSLRISLIIPLSLSSLNNCSVSNLSYSLYWHSAALVLSLPIHSWQTHHFFFVTCSILVIV